VKESYIHKDNLMDFREINSGRIKLEGQYDADGLYQGTHRFWDLKGKIIFEAEFTNGVQTSAKKYFPNGKLELEKHYKAGIPHGPHKAWHPGGEVKAEAFWENGKLHGLQKNYFAGGSLKSEKRYEAGVMVEAREWSLKGTEL